jgi:hypothetical protein
MVYDKVLYVILIGVSIWLWRRQARLQREVFIRNYVLPKGLFEKLRERHPQLTPKDCQLVANGLRQFFLAHLKSGKRYVSMPSQVVDDLWHELILHTKNYQQFCRKAFGSFLHHTPAVVLASNQQGNLGIRRCWHFACREENINPRAASRLPLLFALDTKLAIANGFRYQADCAGVRRSDSDGNAAGGGMVYCAADLVSLGGEGGFEGGSAGGSDAGDGSDGGGCGGGGCGGD